MPSAHGDAIYLINLKDALNEPYNNIHFVFIKKAFIFFLYFHFI